LKIFIQVVKLKKQSKEKNHALAVSRTRLDGVIRRRHKPALSPLGHERLLISSPVNFTTYFFLRNKLPINMKMLVFFLAKCVRTAVKTMVVDRKNQEALALLHLASKPLRKAAKSSGVPTEFATEPTRQI